MKRESEGSRASRALDLRHGWLRPVRIAFVPGPSTPFLDAFLADVAQAFVELGHSVTDVPDEATDAFVSTARFNEPVAWRESMLFTGRKRYRLSAKPANYTFVQVRPSELDSVLSHFERELRKSPASPELAAFPGLAPAAHEVLFEQGRRGGPYMCLARLLQAQAKTLRAVPVIGDETLVATHVMDLAGAYPRVDGSDRRACAQETALRIATHVSTREVAVHEATGDPLPAASWRTARAPRAMLDVSRALGERRFFTRAVLIADLVAVPAITESIASQYSEGCFATWDPTLDAMVCTASGTGRPVDKGGLTEDDLALVTDVRPDGTGARVRQVEGLSNHSASSEAVEFRLMDVDLPRVRIAGEDQEVPVVRSKLHGHRGVGGYDPRRVEYTPLSPSYQHYLVSCSTEAQAWAVRDAFSRSQALRDPDDPRRVVFTVLPGHGMIAVEKWSAERAPFEVLLETMDEGALRVIDGVPQGPLEFVDQGGERRLVTGLHGNRGPGRGSADPTSPPRAAGPRATPPPPPR